MLSEKKSKIKKVRELHDVPRGQASAFLLTGLKELPCSSQGMGTSAADLTEYERLCRTEASPPGKKGV